MKPSLSPVVEGYLLFSVACFGIASNIVAIILFVCKQYHVFYRSYHYTQTKM